MALSQAVPFYQSDALRTVAGPALRPGGLALTDRAVSFCKMAPGARVLDVGCGPGATVDHLRRHYRLAAMGLDCTPAMLDEARRRCGAACLIRGRAGALPFDNGALAALFAECVLSLLPVAPAVLAEWHRALAPGGWLVVSDLYRRNGIGPPPGGALQGCVAGALNGPAVQARIVEAGFRVYLFEDHSPLLRQLAAELVWHCGSLAALRQAGCGGPGGFRPGYFLLVARKGRW
ncbi:DVU_1556 family methyltransferase [Desulfatitalea alkaliphila]|uniref:Class I SAM-dependent methyltransferase n=1 Tax=Desulfatitalea alkaliphila TaxID=2929485 RepID=A0AA41R289_9BACT|nr:class I SAM-dependent methyltransferase [Desulfatitalea alkaliphila]MCJ8499421.1 class I SAM-dependent methyltransferase [Desulfatitalea alkaliphila]